MWSPPPAGLWFGHPPCFVGRGRVAGGVTSRFGGYPPQLERPRARARASVGFGAHRHLPLRPLPAGRLCPVVGRVTFRTRGILRPALWGSSSWSPRDRSPSGSPGSRVLPLLQVQTFTHRGFCLAVLKLGRGLRLLALGRRLRGLLLDDDRDQGSVPLSFAVVIARLPEPVVAKVATY